MRKWFTKHPFFILTLTICHLFASAQSDSLQMNLTQKTKDEKFTFNPRKAIIHSAIIPGWGQITNRKIWKVPIVYSALGTTSYLFFRNLRQYRDSKNAYILATDGDPTNDYLIKQPYFTVKDQPERIKTFRNEVRQNVDYCVLYFVLFWGLNVADAAVDAHLKNFDISDNLSLDIKPSLSPSVQGVIGGIGLTLNF
jgi:hypothetical protein